MKTAGIVIAVFSFFSFMIFGGLILAGASFYFLAESKGGIRLTNQRTEQPEQKRKRAGFILIGGIVLIILYLSFQTAVSVFGGGAGADADHPHRNMVAPDGINPIHDQLHRAESMSRTDGIHYIAGEYNEGISDFDIEYDGLNTVFLYPRQNYGRIISQGLNPTGVETSTEFNRNLKGLMFSLSGALEEHIGSGIVVHMKHGEDDVIIVQDNEIQAFHLWRD